MESAKVNTDKEEQSVEDSSEKVIRISSEYSSLVDKARKMINSDPTYNKKISNSRYIEKLIEMCWQQPIEELKKEREGSEDWLKIKHLKEAPNLKFYDWLRLEMEGKGKKSSKRNKGEQE